MLIKHPVPRAVAASRQHRAFRAGSPSAAAIARGLVCRRTYAAAAATKTSSPAAPFAVSDVNGIKVIARDDGGPTTGLSIVLRAGARYAPVPGLAHLLDKFAWKVEPSNWIRLIVEHREEDGIPSHARDRIVGRPLVIRFISRNRLCIRSMSTGRCPLLC
jgi:hypothetical protein